MAGLRQQEYAVRMDHPVEYREMVNQMRDAWKKEVMEITGWDEDYLKGKAPLDIEHEIKLLSIDTIQPPKPSIKERYREEIRTMYVLLCEDPF